MMNIVIIGAGHLGSRHLQALAHLEEQAFVQVIDPSEDSRTIAEKRFKEACQATAGNVKLAYIPT
jgi:saccharopine dehydrogenase-like NADP-dependent oxidoreductase